VGEWEEGGTYMHSCVGEYFVVDAIGEFWVRRYFCCVEDCDLG
jgi:hypothetical protein